MFNYLIQFRFYGNAKYNIRKLIYDINGRFGLIRERAVPHITLVGPFCTYDENRLIRDFNCLCAKSHLMEFEISGFSTFKENKVIYLDVKPSKELDRYRWNLSQTLSPYCQLSSFDNERDFAFHTTIAMRLSNAKFEEIKNYIKRMSKINFKYLMIRATLLKGGIILREYDFFLRRSLDRRLAKDKKMLARTLSLLKSKYENKL